MKAGEEVRMRRRGWKRKEYKEGKQHKADACTELGSEREVSPKQCHDCKYFVSTI